MVNNSPNINKMNNHLKQWTQNKKDHDIWRCNLGPGSGQAHICGGVYVDIGTRMLCIVASTQHTEFISVFVFFFSPVFGHKCVMIKVTSLVWSSSYLLCVNDCVGKNLAAFFSLDNLKVK
jgi:hypothetical protein